MDTSRTLTHATPITVDGHSPRGRLLTPVLVYVGLLIAMVSSLGSPLIPTLATSYRVSLGTAQWSLTIALLAGALTGPVIGRLGDGPHRRGVLLSALATVCVGSVLAALPDNLFAVLLVGRALQGLGLALLPLAMSVARDHLSTERARSALSVLSVTAVVGVGLGYPVTGLIAEHLGFRAGFWLAAALSAVAMALCAAVVPASSHRTSSPFDPVGAVLLTVGMAALLVGISEGEEWGWASGALLSVFAVAVAFMGVWVWHQLRTPAPLVGLRQMRSRPVLTANVTGVLGGVGMYMMMSMIIRYVQTPTSISYGLGASVVVAGMVLLPLSALSFFSSRFAALLSTWIGPARVLPIGMLAFAVSLGLFALRRDQLWEILVEMGIGGIGIGCSFAVMPRMIVGAIPAEETSSALALNQVLRTVGASIGSALAATILTAHTHPGAEFPDGIGYTVGAVVGIALCAATLVLGLALPRGRGAEASAEDDVTIEENVDAAIAGLIAFEPEPASDPVDRGR